MQIMKAQSLIHAVRVKRAPERATESDQLKGNDKCVRARKVMGSYESETCIQGFSP